MIHRSHRRALAALALLLAAPLPAPGAGAERGIARLPREERPAAPPRRAPSARALPDLPVRFVENRGQVEGPADFLVHGRDRTLLFGEGGVTLSLADGPRRWAARLEFLGAREGVRPEGLRRAATVFSWFRGPREAWKTGVPSYGALVYRDLWPGIDLVYEGTVRRLKYAFVVRPGADPGAIRLAWRGVDGVSVDGEGRLAVRTPAASFTDDRPVSWQDGPAGREEVATAYALGPAPAAGGEREFGFALGAHDPARTLFVDPAVLVYTGFLGSGSGEESGYGIAVDGAGNAYVAGTTRSDALSFPARVGPQVSHSGGENDAFIAKVNASGTDLVYAGFIGGDDDDRGYCVAVDGSGNAYVGGETWSIDEGSFPRIAGPDLTSNGGADGFVAKVNAAGTALLYCGYIGGSGSDSVLGIAVDSLGRAHVTGFTNSSEATFPVAGGPDLTYNGGGDAWVARVAAGGGSLEYCGYVGGAGSESGAGIALDGTGNAYITGNTRSDHSTFPVVTGPDLTYNGHFSGDAYVARVNASGTALVYCGYVGGSQKDEAYGIAVDGDGVAWLVGYTNSSEASFPVSGGPSLVYTGNSDAFVARVAANGTALLSCGYIGGTGFEVATAVAVDGDGNGYVTGYTDSDASSFPVAVGPGLVRSGASDGFVAKVLVGDSSLEYCGYFGGTSNDFPYGIAVDGAGNAYVTGSTGSDAASFPASPGSNIGFVAQDAAFVVKIGAGAGPAGPVASFLLPKKVKAKLHATSPEKSSLVAAGFFDTGPAAEPDLGSGATVTVGGMTVGIPGLAADASGKKFTYSGDGLSLLVKASKFGSSRALFRLKFKGDFDGAVDPEGFLPLGFDNGTVDGGGRVGLTGGAYALGRKPGALVEPNLYLVKAKAALKGEGRDALALTVGLATDGTTPEAAPDLSLDFGGGWTLVVPGGSFLRSGDRFTAKPEGAAVTLDYAKGTLTVRAKGRTLGAFPEGGQSVSVALALGGDSRQVVVRMVRIGTKLIY